MMTNLNRRQVLTAATGIAIASRLPALPTASAAVEKYQARTVNLPARPLPWQSLPYNGLFARPLPSGTDYQDGIAGRRIGDTFYDHPVAQAQCVLSLLSSYRHNQDGEYLRLARANANRLIETAIPSRGGSYFPYQFEFALHGGSDVLPAPWFSGMAQGQALSAFTRLHQTTGETTYLDAAKSTVATFENLREPGLPWVVNIDVNGYAWFEEYADDEHPDFTFNGHGFAVYGLYDYYQLRQEPRTLELYRMGMATVERYIEDIRSPGWISHYCLTHGSLSVGYHNVHTEMLYKFYSMTADTYYATTADALLEDHPNPYDYGTGKIAAGVHAARQFNSRGTVTAAQTVTLPTSESPKVGSRARIKGQDGIWLRIESGSLAGWWVREDFERAFIIGAALQRFAFDPVRLLRFEAGTYTGYQYAKSGAVTASKRASLRAPSSAYADMRALINGRVHYRLTGGIWKDMWLSAEPRLVLAGRPLQGR